jgi:hypothetical protein
MRPRRARAVEHGKAIQVRQLGNIATCAILIALTALSYEQKKLPEDRKGNFRSSLTGAGRLAWNGYSDGRAFAAIESARPRNSGPSKFGCYALVPSYEWRVKCVG